MQTPSRPRIYLSVPHMGDNEIQYVTQAFNSNWMSTIGPNLSAFESAFQAYVGKPSVALSSGTAALHLGLRLLGVGPGDEVLCPTLTFVASVNPVAYLGAKPVFVDSDYASWNVDPKLFAEALRERVLKNKRPKAVVIVHLYGQCADMDPLLEACKTYSVPVLEDAAEALGSRYKDRLAGTLGTLGIYSFNGNKIITTTSGGMLIGDDAKQIEKARYWSQQAREPVVEYHHTEVGYNYRMSNVLAGIGRGQLEVLPTRIDQRRAVAHRYREELADIPGLSPMPQASYGLHTNWLSCFLVDEKQFGISRDQLIAALEKQNIESRPVWKPMHMQPLYKNAECYGGSVAEDLFRRGICLPSSSKMTHEEQSLVIETIKQRTRK